MKRNIALLMLVFLSVLSIVANGSEETAEYSITVNGLKEAFRIFHITDSHVSVLSENEKEYHKYGARMDKAYKTEKHYKTREKTTSSEMFLNLLEVAKKESVDLIVLTGDIVNNPSQSSVSFIYDSLESTKIPYVYIAGNHDWHYEGMQGSSESLRQTWINNSLLPLYGGNNPLYFSHSAGGINFVAIDNSTYQVNEDQLQFYKTQSNRNYPIVLLQHIPLYLEQQAKRKGILVMGHPNWGWDEDRHYRVEKRERWSKNGNLAPTTEYLEAVKNSSNLITVLAGHTHEDGVESVSESANQYVTGPSRFGYYRLLSFEPLL